MKMRASLPKPQLDYFFAELFARSQKTKIAIAHDSGISVRTLRDWERGLYLPNAEILKRLSTKYNIPLPRYQTKPEHWQIPEIARIGAMAMLAKHGAPGNLETRRIAGKISAKKRKLDPEKYRLLGCNVRKQILKPRLSENLAELTGILLGDGGITFNQLQITLDKTRDKLYAGHVASLIYKIFSEYPKIYFRDTVCVITLSGIEYVELFVRIGLKTGNKVRQQVRVPNWVNRYKKWKDATLRGLVDTDGCIYIHKHQVGGNQYEHIGLTFTNHSIPIASWVTSMLDSIGLNPKQPNPQHVYAYGTSSVARYLKIVGTNNPKHQTKYDNFIEKYPQNRYPAKV